MIKTNPKKNAKLTKKEVKLSFCYGSSESSVKMVTIKTRSNMFMACFKQHAITMFGLVLIVTNLWVKDFIISAVGTLWWCRPRWLSWMRRPTEDQEVAGSIPAEVGNILSWRLIMKYFLQSFSPFRWFKKGRCQFLAKECAQYCLTV